ncbi:MAG TPA: adenylate/guanylate cyclase domain-containing protein [Sphingomonas sp.]|nr:adenylate/guanylate cyclase domain-containing protein [Sphingomonas sp.]
MSSPLTEVRQTAKSLGWFRTIATGILLIGALLFARYSWYIPLAVNAERALYDIRAVVTAPRVDQDPRIVLITYTDETLAATAKRSPLDRAILAKALTAIDQMGAKAIGIDILVDQPQPEDQQLIDAMRAMKTPVYLAFASHITNNANMQDWQEKYLTGFQRRVSGGAVRPASVYFLPDLDGTMRKWPTQPRQLPPLLPNAVTRASDATRDYNLAIGYRLAKDASRPVFSKLPIDVLANPALAPAFKEQIAGRYVLIGGDIIDTDQFVTPMTWYIDKAKDSNGIFLEDRPRNGQTIGLEVHAHMLAQLLDGRWKQSLPVVSVWACAFLVVIAGVLTALIALPVWGMALVIVGEALLFTLLPVGVERMSLDTQTLPQFGWAVGWVVAFLAAGSAARALSSEQRNFAQSALGKYLPRDIASEILKNPDSLSLSGEKRPIYVVFTDLEGFTKLSHAIEPEMVATLLNKYLDMLSDVVLSQGGTIDKFVGDAVVAFWGAPIAREDDGQRAVAAALAMYEAGERFRKETPEGVPAIGKTRVGIHYGEAIVGNFGGEGRIQYTALGDAMNTAARLESANKQTKTNVLASGELVAQAGVPIFRALGRVTLRGRSTPLSIWEPAPDMLADERESFSRIVDAAAKGDAKARVELEKMVINHPDDAPLRNLVYRFEHEAEGGYFVLD